MLPSSLGGYFLAGSVSDGALGTAGVGMLTLYKRLTVGAVGEALLQVVGCPLSLKLKRLGLQCPA